MVNDSETIMALAQQMQQLTVIVQKLVVGQRTHCHEPHSTVYNQEWSEYPSYLYGDYNDQGPYPLPVPTSPPPSPQTDTSMEDLMKALATNTLQFQQATQQQLQHMENQIDQLVTSMSRLEEQNLKELSSQPEEIPCKTVNAVTIGSGNQEKGSEMSRLEVEEEKKTSTSEESKVEESKPKKRPSIVYFQEAMKQIPHNAKYLKKFFPHPTNWTKKIGVGENVSALTLTFLSQKCKDPGKFSIPCTTGPTRIPHCLIDLGASVNIMPYSVYTALDLRPLEYMKVVIRLANGKKVYTRGLCEDVIVQVDDLRFPADFYVVDMQEETTSDLSLIFGRPFLMTTKTKIDVLAGTLTMECDDHIIRFNIDESVSQPCEEGGKLVVNVINAVNDLMQQVPNSSRKYKLEIALRGDVVSGDEDGVFLDYARKVQKPIDNPTDTTNLRYVDVFKEATVDRVSFKDPEGIGV